MSTSFKSVVGGMGGTLVLSVLAAVVAYITRIVLARTLEVHDFGLFYAVFTFVIFFLFFRDLGLGQALIKYVSEFRVLEKFGEIKAALLSVFIIQFGSSVLFALVLLLLSDYLAIAYFKDQAAGLLLKILVVYVLTSIFFILTKQMFQSFQRMLLYASVELMKNVLVLLLIIVFFVLGYTNSLAPTMAFALVSIFLFFLYLPWLLQTFHLFHWQGKGYKEVSKKLFLFGIPVFITDVGAQVVGYIDTLMLTYYRTLSEVGVYNVVLPTALMFLFFSKAISSTLLPIAAELWTRNDLARIERGFYLLYKYLFIILLPIVLPLIIFASDFLFFFFGETYVAGTTAFQILLLGVIFYIMAGANHSALTGIGKPRVVTKIILAAAGLNIVLNMLFIPVRGIEGAAIATACSYFLMLIWSTWEIHKYITVAKSHYWHWAKLTIVGMMYLLAIQYFSSVLPFGRLPVIILSVLLGLMIFAMLLYLFRLADLIEIRSLVNKVIKK